MRNPRVILAPALLLILAGLAWVALPAPEPVYEGKKLSLWLSGYIQPTRSETSEQLADHAVRAAGTRAIPTLLRLLQANDSQLKLTAIAWLEKQHLMPAGFIPARDKNWEGMRGFQTLCGDGRGAVNDLVEIYERDISEWSQFTTLNSLAAIGPSANAAVPKLLQWLAAAQDDSQHLNIVAALGSIHSKPDLVVPVLIQDLDAAAPMKRGTAARALGNFGPAAMAAVPALLRLCRDRDATVRSTSLWALKQIDPRAAASIPADYP